MRVLGTEAALLRQAHERGLTLAALVAELSAEQPATAVQSPSGAQLDISGAEDRRARYDEITGAKVKLFEPAPEAIPGQLLITSESEQ